MQNKEIKVKKIVRTRRKLKSKKQLQGERIKNN